MKNHFVLYPRSDFVTCTYHVTPTAYKHAPSELEKKLVEYRNNIDHYTSVAVPNNWEYYKKIVNPYEIIYTKKKYRNFPDSIATVKPLSRSYFKMIEILHLLDFYRDQSNHIRTAHVCEGPGGFIEALYETSMQNKTHIDDTLAMTLHSNRNNIPGWKYTHAFLKKHSTIKIIYGKDNTGDILSVENQQYYIHHAEKHKYDIFTADGGFDFSSNYMKQEQLVFPLLIASTKIGFEVLKQGGSFILKFIDFYNKATLDLLYILSCHFKEWTMYKPATSRPCNPEHYFIGKGFMRCSEDTMDALYAWCNIVEMDATLESLISSDYSPEFTKIIHQIQHHSASSQIEYLTKVFTMIEKNDDHIIQTYLHENMLTSYEWCKTYNVPHTVIDAIEASHISP
jgi:23S rRNA U2552 (ribose-2'-O)-methylase RlmE/FtsJ